MIPITERAQPIEIRRVIFAPIEEVFKAWLDPEGMRNWMSPVGTATMTADFRPGGAFRLVMSDDTRSIEHTGVYRVVERPRQLVFTWRSDFTGGRDTLVTIQLFPQGADRTELVLRHELLLEDETEKHLSGWTAILERFGGVFS